MLDQSTDLKSLLKDPSLLEPRAYINGEFIETGETFDVTNPARGDVIAQMTDLSREDVAKAIDAAYTAQKDWAQWTGKERAAVMRKWFDLMMARASSSSSAKRPSASTAKPSPATSATSASW